MKRTAHRWILTVATLTVLVAAYGVTNAADRKSVGSDVTIEKDEVQRGDVLVVGANLKVLGQVKGSVAVLNGNVEVAPGAEVRGDVVVLGGELKSEGTIAGARVATEDASLGDLLGGALARKPDLEALLKALADSSGGSRVSVGEPVRVEKSDRVDGDVVVIGSDADIAGKVRGAVIVVGGVLNVDEDADIADDAVAIGGRVNLPRRESVRGKAVSIESDWVAEELKGIGSMSAASGSEVEAPAEATPETGVAEGEKTVRGPITHLSGDYTVGPNEHVQGAITILNGDLRVEGQVDGAVTVVHGDVEVTGDGKIGGALTAFGDVTLSGRAGLGGACTAKGDVLVKDHARISGAVTSLSGGEIRTEGEGRIDGPRTTAGLSIPLPSVIDVPAARRDHPVGQWFGMTVLGGGALLLCLAFFGERVRRVERMIKERAGMSFGWGLLVALLAFAASVVLIALIITIPVAFAGWVWLAALMILGGAGLSLFVGNWCMARLGRSDGSLLVRSCLGFGVLSFLQLVALLSRLGPLVMLGLIAAGLLALGAATISDFGGRTDPARPWPFRRRRGNGNGNGGQEFPFAAPPPPPPPPPPPAWPSVDDPYDPTPRQTAPVEPATSAAVKDLDAPLPVLGDEKPEPGEDGDPTGPNLPPPPQ